MEASRLSDTPRVYTFPFAAHEDPGGGSGYSVRTNKARSCSLPDGRPVCSGMASPASTQLHRMSTHCVLSTVPHICRDYARTWHPCATPDISTEYPGIKYLLCMREITLRAPEHYAKLRHLRAPVSTSTTNANQGHPSQARGQSRLC